jgi:hypothetical protein
MTFIKSYKEPWLARTIDFSKPGWHTQRQAAYWMYFEFLRLSPSYELARKARVVGLSKKEKKLLPNDFDQVLNIYDLLGDVQNVIFRDWWLKRGLKVFGNPFNKPLVHQITKLKGGIDRSFKSLEQDFSPYLTDTRREEGLIPNLLLSIPLVGKKSDVLRQFKEILNQEMGVDQDIKKPLISLQGKRIHIQKLIMGMKLLTYKARYPNYSNWRLGVIAKVSKSYSPALDLNAERYTKNVIEQIDREILGKFTFRAVSKYETIAENAARGKFPSNDPCDQLPFDYEFLQTQIRERFKWERAEKERIIQQYKELKSKKARSTRQLP